LFNSITMQNICHNTNRESAKFNILNIHVVTYTVDIGEAKKQISENNKRQQEQLQTTLANMLFAGTVNAGVSTLLSFYRLLLLQ